MARLNVCVRWPDDDRLARLLRRHYERLSSLPMPPRLTGYLMDVPARSMIDVHEEGGRRALTHGRPADRGDSGSGCQPGARLDAPDR
jgi:hypothetical protein